MKQLSISIIIPTYNEERYLPKALASLTKLEKKPDEVIIVDSASTDATVAIARDFGARIIRVPERGIGRARQTGLARAKGDIVAYTDADTQVPPSWLTHILDGLSQKGVVGVYGGFRVYDGWPAYQWYVNYINFASFPVFSFFSIPFAAGQNIAFLRTIGLQAGGFPTKFRSVEDIEIMRRLAVFGKILYLKDNVVSSSGRRGNEGFAMIPRRVRGLFRYIFLRQADSFTFPDFR